MLFGESGGTVTGVLAVQRSPERFRGWIGSGQMVDPAETDRRIYDDLVAAFRDARTTAALDQLRAYGPPPYATPLAYAFAMGHYDLLAGDYDAPAEYRARIDRASVGFMGLGASEYSLIDKINAVRGLMDTFGATYPTWQQLDFRRSVRSLQVPVHLFTGEHELAARRALSDEWLAQLHAPRKRLWALSDAGHATAFEHTAALRRALADVTRDPSTHVPQPRGTQ